jgi:glucose/arabinose dehydrogenase
MRFARQTCRRRRLFVAAGLVVLCGAADPGRAATGLPPGFQDVPVVSGLSSPTAMDFAPDGRLFVTQQGGQLRVIKNGVLLSTPFLTLTVNSVGERGLLGIALDPAFATNQFVYLFYTVAAAPVHNRISRFKANGDVVDDTVPEVVLLEFDNLSGATNHNGGALHFGPDGKLYAAHGENANKPNSQILTNLLGKIIRMNPVQDPILQIPTDNPFYGSAAGKNRLIWTLGLRNPFTFSFQPGTGLTYVNDVGEVTWEEINDARPGRNFGWPTTEGTFDASTFPLFTNPVHAYPHSGTPTACAITGGAFYNPPAPTFPTSYVGKYFFADFCGGWIRYIDPSSSATTTQFADNISFPVDLKVGPDGALYYLARGAGSVGKIISSAPQITQQPVNRVVPVGSTATFTVGATGAALSYQWQKNGVDIPGATAASYTTLPFTLADDNSTYRCRVMNSAGTATSNSATLALVFTHDFSGDGRADIAVFRPSNGAWYLRGISTVTWGGQGDIPLAGDYDGDRISDIAVFRPSTGNWYIIYSSTLIGAVIAWGGAGDEPVTGDYDGDGKTDIAVFRRSTGTWYVRGSSVSATYVWGGGTDIPVPGDYDGDAKTDIAVFRPSTGAWYVVHSSTMIGAVVTWGGAGDLPVTGDYDGDGKTDIAVLRPSTGTWYIRGSSLSATYVWGGGTDIPVPGDYDGDGKTDIAVFRASTGVWYLVYSSTMIGAVVSWGGNGDIPILKRP